MRVQTYFGAGGRGQGAGGLQRSFGELPSPLVPRPSPRKGFTLVEIMLVVIIIGVLAAMVMPRLSGQRRRAENARAKSDIASIGLALDLYELDMGEYPKDLQYLVSQPPAGTTEKRWNGPYLKKGLPDDPWNRHYEYKSPSDHGQDYDLSSLGPDGQKGTDDDVTNWK